MSRAAVSKPPTPAAHLKKWQRINLDPAAEIPSLERYAHGGKFDYEIPGVPEKFPYGASEAAFALNRIALELMRKAQSAALAGVAEWLSDWNKAVTYRSLGFALDYAWHQQASREVSAGARRQPLKMLSLRDAGFLVGAQLSLGHLDAAANTAANCRAALSANYFLDGDSFMPRRAQFCVLQLVTGWRGASGNWPPMALDEPVYARLRETWRSPDASAVAAPLLAACDRHVEQARPSDDSNYYDCDSFEAAWFPFEIHAVLRLRETSGLVNPALEHPLLATALGPLPGRQAPVQDAILAGAAKAAGIPVP